MTNDNHRSVVSSIDLLQAEISGLKNDVPRDADSLEEAFTKLRDLHVKRVERDQSWRQWFLCTFVVLILLTGVMTFVGVIYLMCRGEFNGNVAIAFFATVVVQLAGRSFVVLGR